MASPSRKFICGACLLLWVLLGAGCTKGEGETAEGGASLIPVRLQLDWYAEPAHGGFYQALINGYYEAEGLAVEIDQGGPGAVRLQSIAVGKAQFTIGRIDDAIMGIDRGLPLMVAMAYMQKDPQAIMYHASNDIESWSDLDGRSIMVDPGSAFVPWLKQRYEIDFDILPLDYGIARFLADKDFIQQCFVTSQPFFAEMNGVAVKTMLLSDDQYSPERVVITSRALAKRSPDTVAAFVRASLRGWMDYMHGDPSKTHEHLIELNDANSPELNRYSHDAMGRYSIVEGDPSAGEAMGLVAPEKLERTIEILHELKLNETKLDANQVIDYSLLPEEVRGPALAGSN